MASTITLQNSINYASIFTRLNPLVNVGLVANEPALSIGNWVRQTILGPPFSWDFNRTSFAFLASPGQQEYTLVSWQAGISLGVGFIFSDPNGYQQSVSVGGFTGNIEPTWNQTVGGTTTDGPVTWVNQGAVNQFQPFSATTPLISWIEDAVVIDSTGTAHELQNRKSITTNSQQDLPAFISLERRSTGPPLFSVRLQPVPDQAYTVSLSVQNQAPNFLAPTESWSPIPDWMNYIYNQGFLAKSYEYLVDERYPTAMQLFIKSLLGASSGLTETQLNIFLAERLVTAREMQSDLGNAQMGRAARGLL